MTLHTILKASLLRFFTRKVPTNFDLRDTRKILLLRYDRIGDMIITTPVFRELKQNLPNVKVSVLASKVNKSVLANNPYIDEIHINHKKSFLGDLRTLLELRKKNFDACIEFDHSVIPHSIIRLKIIKPKVIISVNKKGRYGVSGSELKLYDIYTDKKENFHFRDIWLETISPFGIKPKSNDYDLFLTEFEKNSAINFTNKLNGNFLVGFNLTGAVGGKKINYDDFAKICENLKSVNKTKIIVLSEPNKFQDAKDYVNKINLHYVVNSYKTNNITDVAALINQLDLIITPDTAIVHVASTFNKPVVSIHENNSESFRLFAPISKLNRTVFSKSKDSLEGFSVNELLDACKNLIKLIKEEKYE